MAQLAQIGRTLLAPFTNVATWYNKTAQAAPFTVGVVTTGLKTSAADLFAQKVIEKRETIDWQRHIVFTSFGFVYLGAFQYYLYNRLFSQLCGPLTARFGHWGTSPIKVFLDQGIHHPFLYFPSFFGLKTVMAGKPLSAAVDKYRAEIWDSCKALWSVWVPAQLINFGIVPRHLRIPYAAAVSFGWTVIFSVMQGKFDKAVAQELPAAGEAPKALPAAASAAMSAPAAAAAAAPGPPGAPAPAGAAPGGPPGPLAAAAVSAAARPPATIVAAAVAEAGRRT